MSKKIWTKQHILEEIRNLEKKGFPIYEHYILINNNPLRCSARKQFGSWRKTLVAAGFDPKEIMALAKKNAINKRKIWTKEKIGKLIQQRKSEGKPIYENALRSAGFGSMCFAIRRDYGSFKNLMTSLNINYDDVRGDKNFTSWYGNKLKILDKIRELNKLGYELNASSVGSHDKTLYWAARKYFGSWYDAVDKAGFDSKFIRCDRDREANKGNIFELICYEIFKIIRSSWESGLKFKCGSSHAYPDLYDRQNDEWIDFKLRAHGESATRSITKYKKYALRIRIIYLFGKRANQEKVRFNSIFDYEKETTNVQLKKFFNDLRELNRYNPAPIHLEKWAKKWNKKKITKWIKNQPNEELNERNVLLKNNALRCAARRLFGSWKKAVIATDMDYNDVRKTREKITKNELDKFIKKRWVKNQKLNARYICGNFGGEYNAATRIYGGWKQAIESNSISYDLVKQLIHRKASIKNIKSPLDN